MPFSVGSMFLEKPIKVFVNFLDWNKANIVKDIFIQKIIPGREKMLKMQRIVPILKKKYFKIKIPGKF